MMAEHKAYRLVLENLYQHFGHGFITVAEIAKYEGCDPRTVRKRYDISKKVNGIDIAILATKKCELAR